MNQSTNRLSIVKFFNFSANVRMTTVKPAIRLLAIDIDGTLLDPHYQITARNLATLRRAHEAGVEVALVTGRRHAFALPIAQMLGFDLWLISSNGAVTMSIHGERFHHDVLPVATARKLLDHMRDFRGNTVLTFDRDGKGAIIVERTDELARSIARWIEKNMEFTDFVVPLENALVEDPIQAMFCGSIPRMAEAVERLKSAHLANEITVLRTQYDDRDLCIVDVLNQGCSKGHALERWAKYRGFNSSEVMAIGDNYNDVEMLQFAGTPVIMGNASPDLKQNGWIETSSNADSGVAAAVEKVLGFDLVQCSADTSPVS